MPVAVLLGLCLLFGCGNAAACQTVIGGGMPDSSAMLDIQSNQRGVLFPRMTSAQQGAIQQPATGLMVYNTTSGCLEINHGAPANPVWLPLGCLGTVQNIDCDGAVLDGVLTAQLPSEQVTVSVPYNGGNGGDHLGQAFPSTGVTGLTATLPPGGFPPGDGQVIFTISGTPDTSGTAVFSLLISGHTCMLTATVYPVCGAFVAPGEWKQFMCHNLAAANTAADPFTPGWEIIGGYWQWGRKGPPPSQWRHTNMETFAHGPTGPGTAETNEDPIPDWSNIKAADNAWMDYDKTLQDPCPAGFRVPTQAQWAGVLGHNVQTMTGTWSTNPTNYSSGRFFGPDLFLPAAGRRDTNSGGLNLRGNESWYMSSTENGVYAWHLHFGENHSLTMVNSRTLGASLRCIRE